MARGEESLIAAVAIPQAFSDHGHIGSWRKSPARAAIVAITVRDHLV